MKLNRFLKRNSRSHPKVLVPGYKSTIFRSPTKKLIAVPQSFTELNAPVFGHHDIGDMDNNLIENHTGSGKLPVGPRILVHGRIMDQHEAPVANSLIEVWQANAGGRYRHKAESYLAPLDPNFGGYGRTLTDDNGYYRFETIRPGPYPFPNGPNDWRPAHIHFSLFGHAFVQRLVTQMYFEGDPLIPICPIVATLPDRKAVTRLTATHDPDATVPFDMQAYRFDIVLRGREQTYFEGKPEGM